MAFPASRECSLQGGSALRADHERAQSKVTLLARLAQGRMALSRTGNVILRLLATTPEWDTWLTGAVDEATALQRPLPSGLLQIVATGEKSDRAPVYE